VLEEGGLILEERMDVDFRFFSFSWDVIALIFSKDITLCIDIEAGGRKLA